MKHYVISDHYCHDKYVTFDFFGEKMTRNVRNSCELVHKVFFINYEFFIVTFNQCVLSHEKTLEIFNEIYDNKIKVKEYHSMCINNYAMRMSDEIKKIRKEGFKFKRYTAEVNYIYGFNKRYCYITRQPYLEKLFSNIDEDYKKALQYINENEMKNVKDDLLQLYHANSIYDCDVSDRFISSTLNELINELKKKTNF